MSEDKCKECNHFILITSWVELIWVNTLNNRVSNHTTPPAYLSHKHK